MNSTAQRRAPTLDKKELVNYQEVCSIIKACKNSGVSELRLGELHLVFGQRQSKVKPRPLENGKVQPVEQNLITPEERIAERETEIELEEQEELQQLAISNPLEYERRLGEGSLEDENS